MGRASHGVDPSSTGHHPPKRPTGPTGHVLDLAAHLDRLGVPLAATVKECCAVLRADGIGAPAAPVAAAVRHRRDGLVHD